MVFYHQPVMVKEIIGLLVPKTGGIYVDGTIGGGGHTEALFKSAPNIAIIGLDKDADAIDYCKKKFEKSNLFLFQRDFAEIDEVLKELNIELIDGFLFDLGVSSFQLGEGRKGFSIIKEGPLDMRMDSRSKFNAYNVVNSYKESDLVKIFFNYGEEPKSKIIAKAIVEKRKKEPVKTTKELAQIVENILGRGKRRIHPATKIFQALRIEVNQELKSLKNGLIKGINALKKGGVAAVISYHSLEDRIVKETFNYFASDCVCPKDFPLCRCGKVKMIDVITKKPVIPKEEEVKENPRSRSAKLRTAKRCL